jgi:hypothetical protein
MSDFTSATARAYPKSTLEHILRESEDRVLRAKADAFDDLRAGVRWLLEVMGPNGLRDISLDTPEPIEVKADGAEPPPVQAPASEPTPDADPFAPASPTEAQPQPRRGGRRSRRSEEGQPQPQDAGPNPEPQPAPEEGQPLTAEALGLTAEALGLTPEPEPAPQPLPLPVVEAPDVSAAPTSADDVYGTEPAEDPFA